MLTVPEIIGIDSHVGSIRIPPELDVPLTGRVRRIIDTEPFRRLARISQLGLVSLVYPAAHHTRFEHSLGVYRLSLFLLKRLAHVERFAATVSRHDAERLIVAALLHDIGHWPFCHPIEDIRLENFPSHEESASEYLLHGELSDLLKTDWNIDPESIADLLYKKMEAADSISPVDRLLSSILSGPIDIDKMDYLFRDSHHAGVPYGKNLDQGRLIGSLCVNRTGDGLAITEKGKTAAELMVFARYIMFSEVYWHHAVRSATSMLQRLFSELFREGRIELSKLFHGTEDQAIDMFRSLARGTPLEILSEGLFGPRRLIYKRVAQFSIMEQPEIYRKLAGKPYHFLCGIADRLAASLAHGGNRPPYSILIDAPPVEKEVEIRIDVRYPKENRFRSLENVSPVVRAMAREQFDDFVKRVRIFAHPDIAKELRENSKLERHLLDLIADPSA